MRTNHLQRGTDSRSLSTFWPTILLVNFSIALLIRHFRSDYRFGEILPQLCWFFTRVIVKLSQNPLHLHLPTTSDLRCASSLHWQDCWVTHDSYFIHIGQTIFKGEKWAIHYKLAFPAWLLCHADNRRKWTKSLYFMIFHILRSDLIYLALKKKWLREAVLLTNYDGGFIFSSIAMRYETTVMHFVMKSYLV